MQNFRGLAYVNVGGLGKCPVLRIKASVLFSFLRDAHRSHLWTYPTQKKALYVVKALKHQISEKITYKIATVKIK